MRHFSGERSNLTTLSLLFGMMLLCKYLERERLVQTVLSRLLAARPPARGRVRSAASEPDSSTRATQLGSAAYVFRVALLTYALSALFTNDATCLLLTPLVLQHWRRAQRCARPHLTLRVLERSSTVRILVRDTSRSDSSGYFRRSSILSHVSMLRNQNVLCEKFPFQVSMHTIPEMTSLQKSIHIQNTEF